MVMNGLAFVSFAVIRAIRFYFMSKGIENKEDFLIPRKTQKKELPFLGNSFWYKTNRDLFSLI